MKKLFAFVFFSILSLASSAQNLACDMQRDAYAVDQCYAGQLRIAQMEMDYFLGQVYESRKLSQDFKNNYDKQHSAWVKKANTGCMTNVCVYMKVIYRRNEIGTLLNQLDKQKEPEQKDVKTVEW
jgi:hypothetical protein